MRTAANRNPLEAVVRDHGARIALRHGRRVAVDFGSLARETAVCRRSVGLADRFGRVTFEVRGGPAPLALALARVDRRGGGPGWAAWLDADLAIVRCEASAQGACRAALDDDGLLVLDVTGEHAALGLVGPRAPDVLAAAGLDARGSAATVLRDADGVEILVPRHRGPAVWAHLLRSGAAHGIACVGFDALRRLAGVRHLGQLIDAEVPAGQPSLAGG